MVSAAHRTVAFEPGLSYALRRRDGAKSSMNVPIQWILRWNTTMENHRKSKIKKLRKSGFRARMRTQGGRKIINQRRRVRAGARAKRK